MNIFKSRRGLVVAEHSAAAAIRLNTIVNRVRHDLPQFIVPEAPVTEGVQQRFWSPEEL